VTASGGVAEVPGVSRPMCTGCAVTSTDLGPWRGAQGTSVERQQCERSQLPNQPRHPTGIFLQLMEICLKQLGHPTGIFYNRWKFS